MTESLARIDVLNEEAYVGIAVVGELDLSNAEDIEQRVLDAIPHDAAVLLELRSVTYIDSRGIRMLVNVARAAADRGARLDVVAPPDSIAGGVLLIANVTELNLVDP